jgi:hypothetical protein
MDISAANGRNNLAPKVVFDLLYKYSVFLGFGQA